jgi:hypothetical protein
MDGEGRKEINGIYINLKDHFEAILEEKERRYGLIVSDAQEALRIARRQQEKHDEGVNQFQKRMDKLEGTFATSSDLIKSEQIINDKLISLEKLLTDRLRVSNRVIYGGGALIIFLNIVLRFIKF